MNINYKLPPYGMRGDTMTEGGYMIRKRNPFEMMWRDMEDMRAELESMFQSVSSENRLLPAGGMGDRILPAIRGEFRVDVREHDEDVIVVADLPGVDKESVALQLISPRLLEIACTCKQDTEEKSKNYYIRERTSGSMGRMITPPADMTEDDAKASFKNGILEVRLKKRTMPQKSCIAIE
jgi:HSP20 family protein